MSRSAGFTLIELMIVVTLLAILMMVAAPSVRDIILNARMTAQVNNLMTDLAIARSEAVKRGVRTAICTIANDAMYGLCSAVPPAAGPPPGCQCTNPATANQWNQGWIIFTDSDAGGNAFGTVNGTDAVLKVVPAIDGANEPQPNTITSANTPAGGNGPWVGFRPSGVINPGGLGSVTFTLCDSRTTANVAASAAANKGRLLTLTGTGRASITKTTCP